MTKHDITEEKDELSLAIGRLVLEWNGLQESLLLLFGFCLTGSIESRIAAVWHSTPNDRAQREMLRAAVETHSTRVPIDEYGRTEIVWLVNEANKLADQRNSVIHSPFIMTITQSSTTFVPNALFHNPRATQLSKKQDLLEEIRWYQQKAEVLALYA